MYSKQMYSIHAGIYNSLFHLVVSCIGLLSLVTLSLSTYTTSLLQKSLFCVFFIRDFFLLFAWRINLQGLHLLFTDIAFGCDSDMKINKGINIR